MPPNVKSKSEIKLMIEGGKILSDVKHLLRTKTYIGQNAANLDKLAEKQIIKLGGKPSFKMVAGYKWTTCINVNQGVVHGIPKVDVVFKDSDVVSVDVGVFFKGYHTDTSFSVSLGKKYQAFLEDGKKALRSAIRSAKVGNYIYDISRSIEQSLIKDGLNPIKGLVGHGVGKNLHEEPAIPCLVYQERLDTDKIIEGNTFAIEVMYTLGSGDIVLEPDGWTISTKDAKISALFEDTVLIRKNGPLVLTD